MASSPLTPVLKRSDFDETITMAGILAPCPRVRKPWALSPDHDASASGKYDARHAFFASLNFARDEQTAFGTKVLVRWRTESSALKTASGAPSLHLRPFGLRSL